MGKITLVGKRPSGATREEANRLKDLGFSYGAIGKLWGVSRQRVEQIAKGLKKQARGQAKAKPLVVVTAQIVSHRTRPDMVVDDG